MPVFTQAEILHHKELIACKLDQQNPLSWTAASLVLVEQFLQRKSQFVSRAMQPVVTDRRCNLGLMVHAIVFTYNPERW